MGVPGLRLCSDIVADGVDELHTDRTAAPLEVCAGSVGVRTLGEMVCACFRGLRGCL